ncbi:mechanosensitive ion channel [Methanosarcina sp. DH2]|jgi:small-conductance mechanosensitive channel|uniref:mechanosensitive ion channel family protein n=1 Tax=Methanosarcina sp. DH2 TaxID=2605639 RepID=UPI001E3418D5|nr:mechanosensitive ion channel domain-containing protein [Methanosarcina sp. DH2]MCC4770436.1 mechanosensitive ion channel [Methanosarcina sp. DH2]
MRVIQSLNTFIFLALILFTAYMRYLTDFFDENNALLDSLLASLIVILLAYIINSLAGDFILKRVTTARDRYALRKTVSILVTVLAFASFIAIWIERTSTLIIAYGILSAGIAIALQDLLRSIAGGILIITSNPFKAGDRIQVGDNIGDVLDIGNFSTKLMEIREWENSDQYTGRIIQLPNSFVLNQPIKNYTRDFSFIWDEIRIMLIYGSNWKKAQEIILKIADPIVKEFESTAKEELLNMEEKYFLATYDVQTNTYTSIGENWIELRLRYVVDPLKRREVNNLLASEILEGLEKEEDIVVGTLTNIGAAKSSGIEE